jgi:hypothetical protein
VRVCPRCRSIYSKRTQFCGIDGERLAEQLDDPLIGHQVDRYHVVEKLGQGASGCVYRARHSELETDFALKVLFGDLGSDETIVGRFRREAQTASKIRSPNVVSVVDFGTTGEGLTYLVMEYAEGKSLRDIIKDEGPVNPLRTARITAHVARGLAAAHRLGFVHRDVKPANVVLAREAGQEVAKLLDFGIVRIEAEQEDSTKLTGQGLVVGTPAYMAPEQAKASDVTPAADLYGLGVMVFEMLTGTKPFNGSSVPEIVHKHAHEPPPVLESCGGLEALVAHLLAKQPSDRPESAVAVAAEAERIQTMLSGSMTGAGSAAPRAGSSSGEHPKTDGAQLLQETLARSGTGSMTMRRPPVVLIASVVTALVIGVLAVGYAHFSKTDPVITVVTPPPPPVASPRERLVAALSKRGLSEVDLAQLEGGANLNPAAEADLEALVRVAETAPITADFLRARLDRLDLQVAEKAGMSPEQRARVEARYLELYKQINATQTAEGLTDISRSIAAFEREVGSMK